MLPPAWGFLALLLRPYGSIHWASAAALIPVVWWSVSRPSGDRPDAFAAAIMLSAQYVASLTGAYYGRLVGTPGLLRASLAEFTRRRWLAYIFVITATMAFLISIFLPSLSHPRNPPTTQQDILSSVATALFVFQRDHGRPPADLDELLGSDADKDLRQRVSRWLNGLVYRPEFLSIPNSDPETGPIIAYESETSRWRNPCAVTAMGYARHYEQHTLAQRIAAQERILQEQREAGAN
jgi:hypothetical protein